MFSPTVLGLEAWDQGISRNALSLKALEKNVFHAFLWDSGVASRPWPALAISASTVTGPSFFCESVSSQGFSSLCVYLCLSVSLSSYNRASQAALVVKNPPAHAGDIRDVGSVAGLGRSPGGGHGNPLQCSCLQSPMDRGAWQATIHSVAMSQTWPKRHRVHAFHKIFFFLL